MEFFLLVYLLYWYAKINIDDSTLIYYDHRHGIYLSSIISMDDGMAIVLRMNQLVTDSPPNDAKIDE